MTFNQSNNPPIPPYSSYSTFGYSFFFGSYLAAFLGYSLATTGAWTSGPEIIKSNSIILYLK